MENSYWARVTNTRLARRRLLIATGGSAAAAALLAACGGGDNGSKEPAGEAGLVTKNVDDTNEAKRGGTLKFLHPLDQQTLDPMTTSLPNQLPVNSGYSQLVFYKGGHLEQNSGELSGDIAESWEVSPDKLTITMKITQNAHFNPKAPTSGRAVDAQDVIYSWNRFKASATRRADLAHEIDPNAVVESITATDKNTVVMKLTEPHATVMHLLGNTQAGSFFIVPREVETNNLDLRLQHYGSGPWILDNYTPSVSYSFKKNPGFGQDKRGLPYMDGFDAPIITEYAQWLAQFRAGNIHYMTNVYGSNGLRAEDIIPTKKEMPVLEMHNIGPVTERTRMWFGQLQGSPFRDERVRQAFVKAWDRDLFIDARFNTSGYEKEGVEMPTSWNTALYSTTWKGWWLDPRSKDFGPNSTYFQYDIKAAKDLMKAAGFENGFDTVISYPKTGYPATYYSTIEQLLGMSENIGIKAKRNPVEFSVPAWREPYEYALGKFDGLAAIPDSGFAEPSAYTFVRYNSHGSSFFGFDENGQGTAKGDPTLDDLTLKMRREFDDAKRKQLIFDFQKYEAKKMYEPMAPGGTVGFELAWPAVRGRDVWQGETNRNFANIWLDTTKPPFKSS